MPAALFISRNEATQLSGASATVVNKAIEQRAIRTKASKTGSMIDARDVGALQLFSSLPVGLPVTLKRKLSAWLRVAAPGAELPLSDELIFRRTSAIDEAIIRALRYVELRERFLEVNPDIQGGEPVIRGTRIAVRGLAKQIEAGETLDVLREEYDYIDPDAFEFATTWAKANPRRGRPARLRPPTGPEPADRTKRLQQRRERAAAPSR